MSHKYADNTQREDHNSDNDAVSVKSDDSAESSTSWLDRDVFVKPRATRTVPRAATPSPAARRPGLPPAPKLARSQSIRAVAARSATAEGEDWRAQEMRRQLHEEEAPARKAVSPPAEKKLKKAGRPRKHKEEKEVEEVSSLRMELTEKDANNPLIRGMLTEERKLIQKRASVLLQQEKTRKAFAVKLEEINAQITELQEAAHQAMDRMRTTKRARKTPEVHELVETEAEEEEEEDEEQTQ